VQRVATRTDVRRAAKIADAVLAVEVRPTTRERRQHRRRNRAVTLLCDRPGYGQTHITGPDIDLAGDVQCGAVIQCQFAIASDEGAEIGDRVVLAEGGIASRTAGERTRGN